MIRRALGVVVACGCLMAGVVSLQAHHSLAGVYDMSAEKEIKGTLTKIQFVNPHGSMTITVKNDDGTTTDWTFTTGSATTLADRGISKVGPNALKIDEAGHYLLGEDVHNFLCTDPRACARHFYDSTMLPNASTAMSS